MRDGLNILIPKVCLGTWYYWQCCEQLNACVISKSFRVSDMNFNGFDLTNRNRAVCLSWGIVVSACL